MNLSTTIFRSKHSMKASLIMFLVATIMCACGNDKSQEVSLNEDNPDDAYIIGLEHFLGIQGDVNLDQAGYYWTKSANMGNTSSMVGLYAYYKEQGLGSIGLEWLEKAVSQNDPNALFTMGMCYLEGADCVKNIHSAKDYFEMSYSLGYEDAAEILNKINIYLEQEKIDNAIRQAKEEYRDRVDAINNRPETTRPREVFAHAYSKATNAQTESRKVQIEAQNLEEELEALKLMKDQLTSDEYALRASKFGEKIQNFSNTPVNINVSRESKSEYKYIGTSGKRYKYDLSVPLERFKYIGDLEAQVKDRINVDVRIERDQNMNQYGGGAEY